VRLALAVAFNRTGKELKLNFKAIKFLLNLAFNRTGKELKLENGGKIEVFDIVF